MTPSWRRIVGVAAAGFGVRALFLLSLGRDARYAFTPDSIGYVQAARNLSDQGVFSLSQAPPLIPDTVRTPGYPLFLSFFCRPGLGPDSETALWAQAVIGALACALAYGAALLLWKSEDAALVAGLGQAVDPVSVMHTGLLLTETLFQAAAALALFLLCAAAALGPRREASRWWLAAGVFCGAAALVRPVGLYFFIVPAALLALAWTREGLSLIAWRRALLMFAAAACLAPAAWTLRNARRAGAYTFSSIQGLNFFGMRSAAVEMELTGQSFDVALAHIQARLASQYPSGFISPAQEARASGRWAARFLLSHPLAYGKVMAKDAAKMMGGHGLEIFAWISLKDPACDPMSPQTAGSGAFSGTRGLMARHPGLRPALAFSMLFLLTAYLLAARGLALALRARQWSQAAVAVSPVVYYLAVSVGALAYYRLRTPLMPAVFVLAGRGCLPEPRS